MDSSVTGESKGTCIYMKHTVNSPQRGVIVLKASLRPRVKFNVQVSERSSAKDFVWLN